VPPAPARDRALPGPPVPEECGARGQGQAPLRHGHPRGDQAPQAAPPPLRHSGARLREDPGEGRPRRRHQRHHPARHGAGRALSLRPRPQVPG